MDIQIVEHIKESLQVIIKCRQINEEVMQLKNHIELFDKKFQARKGDAYFLVNSADVFYFEAVDNRTFLYTQNDVMEIKLRLYELEQILSPKDFIRISKSLIVNIGKITSLRPELNRTILVTMCNGERLYVSRKYVQALRRLLQI